MTVQYNPDVLTGGPVVFLRLLLRWKGCVIKLIYIDFLVFIAAYTIVSCIYRFALNVEQQEQFASVVLYVFNFQKMIPISFILGFYVQLVFSRFWQQFNCIPWVFTPTLAVVGAITVDGRGRAIRRTCVRYLNASLIIASSRLHVAVKKRFPSTQHLVQAGILTQREGDLIDTTDPVSAQPFLPIVWATAIAMRAEKDGFIKNPHALVNLIQVINNFRESLLRLFLMDKISIPLVYTQVVTLAVYSYFVSSIIGRQFILNSSKYSENDRKDYYVPIYTILEFIVYMGWLKVAETLVNPMGEDDEDFDVNAIIDLNWSYGMHMVDKKHNPPELVKDKFWDAPSVSLPHTADSKKLQSSQMIGSMFTLDVAGLETQDRTMSTAKIRAAMEAEDRNASHIELPELPERRDRHDSHTSQSEGLPLPSLIVQPPGGMGEAILPALEEEDEDMDTENRQDNENTQEKEDEEQTESGNSPKPTTSRGEN